MSGKRYFILTPQGELGPLDRFDIAERLRRGEVRRSDRLRTALGHGCGTIGEFLDQTADETAGQRVTTSRHATDVRGARPEDGSRSSPASPAAPARRWLLPALLVPLAAIAFLLWYRGSAASPGVSDPGPPVLTLAATDADWTFGNAGTLTLHLDRPGDLPLVIPVELSGTAIAGIDVAPVATPLTIVAGQQTLVVPLTALPASAGRRPAVALIATVDDGNGWTVTRTQTATCHLLTPPPSSAGAPTVTWLSDLATVREWTWMHGAAARDQSFDGGRLTIGGQSYDRGLGTHAGEASDPHTAEMVFALDGGDDRFLCDIGVDDESGTLGSGVFQVWLDGRIAFASRTLTNRDPAQSIAIPVAGARELRLVSLDGGDGRDQDHLDWAAARLVRAARR